LGGGVDAVRDFGAIQAPTRGHHTICSKLHAKPPRLGDPVLAPGCNPGFPPNRYVDRCATEWLQKISARHFRLTNIAIEKSKRQAAQRFPR
jgi:hypothetical protein